MKNRTKIFLNLVVVILITLSIFVVNIKESYAFSLKDLWGSITGAISKFFSSPGDVAIEIGVSVGTFLLSIVFKVVFLFLWVINNLLASIIDFIANNLNPFPEEGISPVEIIWNIIKNFAYILLTFSALFAGFQWLFGEDTSSKRLIFNIVLVALMINFTFVLVKEAFLLVDSLEKGLTGGESKKIGTLMAASMWKGNDPFELVKQVFENNQNIIQKGLGEILAYIFIVILQMIMFIILVITAVIYIARHILVIFYAGVSSFAIASLVFPESKGVLSGFLSKIKFFDSWIQGYIKWLLVIPLLAILVIIGNVIQITTFERMISAASTDDLTNDLLHFIIALIFMASWYLIAIRISVSLSGEVGNLGKLAATKFLTGLGVIAASGLGYLSMGKVGKMLQSAGRWVEQRVGPGGVLGIGTWIHQNLGTRIKGTGEKLIEKRYKDEAEIVQGRISTLEERLKSEKDPQKIQKLDQEFNSLIDKYKNVPYVFRKISENIGKMDSKAFNNLEINTFKKLGSPTTPQELRNGLVVQMGKMSKGDVNKRLKDINFLQALDTMASDVQEAFSNQVAEKTSTEDVLEILADDGRRNFFLNLAADNTLRKSINKASEGLFEAILIKDIEKIAEIFASQGPKFWRNTDKLKTVFNKLGYTQQDVENLLNKAFFTADSSSRTNIINAALQEHALGKTGLIVPWLQNLYQQDPQSLVNVLNIVKPQEQAAAISIFRSEISNLQQQAQNIVQTANLEFNNLQSLKSQLESLISEFQSLTQKTLEPQKEIEEIQRISSQLNNIQTQLNQKEANVQSLLQNISSFLNTEQLKIPQIQSQIPNYQQLEVLYNNTQNFINDIKSSITDIENQLNVRTRELLSKK